MFNISLLSKNELKRLSFLKRVKKHFFSIFVTFQQRLNSSIMPFFGIKQFNKIPVFHTPWGKMEDWWSRADVHSCDDTHGSCSSNCCICKKRNKESSKSVWKQRQHYISQWQCLSTKIIKCLDQFFLWRLIPLIKSFDFELRFMVQQHYEVFLPPKHLKKVKATNCGCAKYGMKFPTAHLSRVAGFLVTLFKLQEQDRESNHWQDPMMPQPTSTSFVLFI